MTIYLDYNATAPLKACVREAMADLPAMPYNPSSIHRYGREARRLIEQARESLLHSVNAKGYRLIFTGSGTEANNLALKGCEGYGYFVSAIEHVSVLKAANNATMIPVDATGVVKVSALETLLSKAEGKKLVSVMLVNNETGVVQPIAEVAAIAHKYGALVHSDAVQGFGKISLDLAMLGVDMLTICAHKCGGPQGIAALILKKGIPLSALIAGGGQELGYRAGTENVAAIIGFAAAVTQQAEVEREQQRLKRLQEKLESALGDKAVICGQEALRLSGTSVVIMPGVSSEAQLIQFDLHGIAISNGSACSSGRMTVSHVLLAMGVPSELARCAIRVSMGEGTTEEEIETFITLWKKIKD